MPDFDLRLNPDLDTDELAKRYQRDEFVRIDNIFPHEIANAILGVLAKETPWHIVHSDAAGKHKYYNQIEWQQLGQATQQKIFKDVYAKARQGFAYLYYVYPMINMILKGKDPQLPLHDVTKFLNADEFREFVKTVTAEPNVTKIDAQATYYAPGHFLNTHDDTGDIQERRAAYVLGFSKDWRVDWGGQLLFLDENGNPSGGFNQAFNSLSIFKVPRQHIVTQVASFAGKPRYSITGWLRDDPVPS